ncbi:hypothetical protein D0463_13750 [Bacillus sp. V59.32b]|nr:hypothetical protein D0463_13750 [Bacillus sp. V59.32b]
MELFKQISISQTPLTILVKSIGIYSAKINETRHTTGFVDKITFKDTHPLIFYTTKNYSEVRFLKCV